MTIAHRHSNLLTTQSHKMSEAWLAEPQRSPVPTEEQPSDESGQEPQMDSKTGDSARRRRLVIIVAAAVGSALLMLLLAIAVFFVFLSFGYSSSTDSKFLRYIIGTYILW